uniref:Uncharacterized protein n=1 Tax=Arundo donax TaxID=35708 RepID=A0A0A9FNQ5_ARUDO
MQLKNTHWLNKSFHVVSLLGVHFSAIAHTTLYYQDTRYSRYKM